MMRTEHRPSRDPSPETASSREAYEALSELLDLMRIRGREVADELGLPLPAVMALKHLDEPIAMNKLGVQMGYDPSFVTSIADTLEARGLVVREPDPADRRVKKLRLTAKGRTTKAKLLAALADDLPGIRRLAASERETFIALLRTMVAAERGGGSGR
jgi:DNA-binding MarR family transcriptional regulator